MKKIYWFFCPAIITTTLLLNGCSLGLIAAKSAANNVSIGTSLDDFNIAWKVQMLIYHFFNNSPHAQVESVTFNHKTIITGYIPSPKLQIAFFKKLFKIKDIYHNKIYNFTQINSHPPHVNYLTDAIITAEVKAETWQNANAMHYKIFTFDHTVYLIGNCPKKECQTVLNHAAKTKSVKKVIDVLTPKLPLFPIAKISSISLVSSHPHPNIKKNH